ncbi:MAG: DUF512 domain-containing protein [Eubacteriales bacterium]|nr:DUF512 domain-containing protein [Eubacteriales bacterium]
MEHLITGIEPHSIAQRHGVLPGDRLLSINSEKIIDEIDYQAFIANPLLRLSLIRRDGRAEELVIRKEEGEPLGLHFGESMTLSPRTCRNKCAFCFIDQMPPNLRESLYVKDDDWRYSLMMGNFVTLTNVDDTELDRIIRRHASPLYISVHTTNPDLRCRMMNNRFAGNIMERLQRLKAVGIRFHCQIVVCPGYNDGPELLRTLTDLRSLAPAAQTVAMVPVGLTKYRDGLASLTPFTKDAARALLDMIAPFQEECRKALGSTFAFPSDEFFCLAGREIPPEDWYEDFPQIENGVGLLRRLESEMEEAAHYDDEPEPSQPRRYVLPTGVSAAPHLRRLIDRFAPKGTTVRVIAVPNHFFGETVTVTGLLTGGDILAALTAENCADCDEVLLCTVTLRHEGDLFLDDMSIDTFRASAPLPVRLTDNDGQALYDALRGRNLH